MTQVRTTRYKTAILSQLTLHGHATNKQLHVALLQQFPKLSATTVHRATANLARNNEISEAPADAHGSIRYDHKATAHDHFICTGCGGMRDISVADAVIPTISEALGGCKITGQLVIYGACESCYLRQIEK